MKVEAQLSGLNVKNASAIRRMLVAILSEETVRLDPQARINDLQVACHSYKLHIVEGVMGVFRPRIEIHGEIDSPKGSSRRLMCACPDRFFCTHLTSIAVHALNNLEIALANMSQPDRLAGELLRRFGFEHEAALEYDAPLHKRAVTKLGRPLKQEESSFLSRMKEVFGDFRNGDPVESYGITPDSVYRGGEKSPIIDGRTLAASWHKRPLDVLEFWSYLALQFTENSVLVPPQFLALADLEWASKQREEAVLRREIAAWQKQVAELDLPAQIPERMEAVDLRIRLKAEGRSPVEARVGNRPYRAINRSDPVGEAYQRSNGDGQFTGRSLALCRRLDHSGRFWFQLSDATDRTMLASVLSHEDAASAVVREDGSPLRLRPEGVKWSVTEQSDDPKRLRLAYLYGDEERVPETVFVLPGRPAVFLDLVAGTYAFGVAAGRMEATAVPLSLPKGILEDETVGRYFARARIALPEGTPNPHKLIFLTGVVRIEVSHCRPSLFADGEILISVSGSDDQGTRRAGLTEKGWSFGEAPSSHFAVDELRPLVAAVQALGAIVPGGPGEPPAVRLKCDSKAIGEVAEWLQSLPRDARLELDPELAHLPRPATAGEYRLSVVQDPTNIDWFDVDVGLSAEGAGLTPREIKLLARAKGAFVNLGSKGWRRLQVLPNEQMDRSFARLGLSPSALAATEEQLRYHALQLSDPDSRDLMADQAWSAVCQRAAKVSRPENLAIPSGVTAELRPYQRQGFEFLSFLSHNSFGGILADDMGLGKTLQTLTWFEALREAKGAGFRALVVCPKSVAPNWIIEAQRFTPKLIVSADLRAFLGGSRCDVLVINYTQLGLNTDVIAATTWTAAVLDEGQNIKNPQSAKAVAACALKASHRLVLTGTPVENRLLDLWSLMRFAQPGLLGNQASFKRLYCAKDDNPQEANERLSCRIRHFLLRRTKEKVAPELPEKIEEEIVCELPGAQGELYAAELKRARLLISGVPDQQTFNKERLHILAALTRLRQICCHPSLVGSDETDSGKLEALLDLLEPIVAEGSKVLVFSQFVEMLKIISGTLHDKKIAHLMLTGQTENRQELVETFQNSKEHSVFLLSLKAAGAGLNLTAASYVVLYDPWWNPAVESQAIDRTHRIGQTSRVIAYRLMAKNTVEEKIRFLQKDKQIMAAQVVKDADIGTVMDLDSLRTILG